MLYSRATLKIRKKIKAYRAVSYLHDEIRYFMFLLL